MDDADRLLTRAEAREILGVTEWEMKKLHWAELISAIVSPISQSYRYSSIMIKKLASEWKKTGIPWPEGVSGRELWRRFDAKHNRRVVSVFQPGIKTTPEAAKFLGMSVTELQAKTKSGEIPYLIVGFRRCYEESELRKYMGE